MKLYVYSTDDKVHTIEVDANDKVISIKRKFEGLFGLHCDNQCLMYCNKVLDDNRTLNEYKITEESLLCLTKRHLGSVYCYR